MPQQMIGQTAFRNAAKAADNTTWTVIPYMGRTLSGLALMPYTEPSKGGELTYRLHLPSGVSSVKVHVAVKSTLAYNGTGHHYEIGFGNNSKEVVCFNAQLNEDPENISAVYYPTVARRVRIDTIELPVTVGSDGLVELSVKPLDAGIVFEKIAVDYGGYKDSYLMMNETPYRK